ncbi:MAG: inositol monophosphatase family protein [Bacteroidales bacterium]|nr:inositol monophosphatase family protein [Bacteroidales bacterium]MDD4215954.1 inositol monophosphatase family protein [Bacteroidales bacterium]MDY0141030.1 inositol monophosphatase family protein [Bacteroidales bacterium]
MELKSLTLKVAKIAKNAGKIIKDNFGQITPSSIETKGLNDYVTETDKLSEKYIVAELSKLIPESGFIAEEGTSDKVGETYNWIIDPLDGTTNFIHGFYPCAVSIALMQKDKIIIGVVYETGLDECFYACEDGGAWLNGKKITVSNKSIFKNSLWATGFPYQDFEQLDEYIDLLKFLTKNTQGIRRLGSAATDMAYVACGRFDGFYEYDLKPYDVAAGCILVSEAGGKLCDFSKGNNYIFGKEIVASNLYIFKDFSEIVKQYMKS